MLGIDIPHRNIWEETCLVRHASIAFCGSLKEQATILDLQSAHSFGRPPRHIANTIGMGNMFWKILESPLRLLQHIRPDLNLGVCIWTELRPRVVAKKPPFILRQKLKRPLIRQRQWQ